MTITTVLLAVFGVLLVAAYALWDLGADELVAGFGRLVIRVITFGHVRLTPDSDHSAAMGTAAATLIAIFMVFLIVASRVH